jgi:hypothetical protein
VRVTDVKKALAPKELRKNADLRYFCQKNRGKRTATKNLLRAQKKGKVEPRFEVGAQFILQ